MTPGIYPDMTWAEYRAIDAAHFSGLKHFRRSAAHALEAIRNPPAPTAAQELGTLVHLSLLEPARLADQYVVLPDFATGLTDDKGKGYANPRATNKYKALVAEFMAAHKGKTMLDPAHAETCRAVAEAVAGHVTAAEILSTAGGLAEVVIVWTDPETGVLCKGRMDHWTGSRVADIKTTDDASAWAFAKSVHQYGWHLQSAFYLSGLVALGKKARSFVHVACETDAPHAVAVYELDDPSLDEGLRQVRSCLGQYAECRRTEHWPAYPDAVQSLSIPKYALTKEGLV